MTTAFVLSLLTAVGAWASEPMVNLRIVDDWRVELSAAGVDTAESVMLEIAPPQRVTVTDEHHRRLPLFNPHAGGWARGAKPYGIQTEECCAPGKIYVDTFRVKRAVRRNPSVYEPTVDYLFDTDWGTFGRVEDGSIRESQSVYIDYVYETDRLDTIGMNEAGDLRVFRGTPGLGVVYPAVVSPAFTAVARVFVPGQTTALTEDLLFPLYEDADDAETAAVDESPIEKTLAKLRSGAPLTLVSFGDSVTCGGGVGKDQSRWWQGQFLARLKARFPKAQIDWKNAGWGGVTSMHYMAAEPGGEHDYVRDVLEPRPDLVIMEFVNDAGLDEAGVAAHYGKILNDLRAVDAELILMTPHLILPSWMGLDSFNVKEDPRAYVRGLKEFAEANNLALADGSTRYCALWRQGIPYMTLMTNAINHPDYRGHALFADALLALFPEK